MKTALKIATGLSALTALTGLASVAHAQNSASASATGSATILQSIAISPTASLGFGTIVRPASGTSTIAVGATNNSRTITGSALAANTGNVSSAAFMITGEGQAAISMSAPNFTMYSGTNGLLVTTTPSATSGNLSGTLGAAAGGSFVLGVGGSFPLSSTTPTGSYQGTLTVTAQYN